jgi:hypothetical protein
MNVHHSVRAVEPGRLLCLGCLAVLASLTTAACNSAPQVEAKDSAALLKEVQAEIGDAACDEPQQCRSIAIGNKACGGPDAYLAWSTKRNGDGSKLQALVSAHAAVRAEENRIGGMASNCAMVLDPGASCQANQCRLLRSGFGNQPAR